MAKLYLFTWNLGGEDKAHELAVEQLARHGRNRPFIACLQELPGSSWIAKARSGPLAELTRRKIAVISTPGKIVRGLALAHRDDLTVVQGPFADEDDEFVAAVFQRRVDTKTIAVVGVHAKSKIDMHEPADRGGSRALLRHALHALKLSYDHLIVLGDFNSELDSREMESWHGFYALSKSRPITKPSAATRRGFAHPPPLYVVRPENEAMGTFAHGNSGGNENPTLDFIVVDEATRANARAKILTEVASKSVWSWEDVRPNLSDHLPVDGTVDI